MFLAPNSNCDGLALFSCATAAANSMITFIALRDAFSSDRCTSPILDSFKKDYVLFLILKTLREGVKKTPKMAKTVFYGHRKKIVYF